VHTKIIYEIAATKWGEIQHKIDYQRRGSGNCSGTLSSSNTTRCDAMREPLSTNQNPRSMAQRKRQTAAHSPSRSLSDHATKRNTAKSIGTAKWECPWSMAALSPFRSVSKKKQISNLCAVWWRYSGSEGSSQRVCGRPRFDRAQTHRVVPKTKRRKTATSYCVSRGVVVIINTDIITTDSIHSTAHRVRVRKGIQSIFIAIHCGAVPVLEGRITSDFRELDNVGFDWLPLGNVAFIDFLELFNVGLPPPALP